MLSAVTENYVVYPHYLEVERSWLERRVLGELFMLFLRVGPIQIKVAELAKRVGTPSRSVVRKALREAVDRGDLAVDEFDRYSFPREVRDAG